MKTGAPRRRVLTKSEVVGEDLGHHGLPKARPRKTCHHHRGFLTFFFGRGSASILPASRLEVGGLMSSLAKSV